MVKIFLIVLFVVVTSVASYVFVSNKKSIEPPKAILKGADILSQDKQASPASTYAEPSIKTQPVTPKIPTPTPQQFKIIINSVSPTTVNFGDSLTIRGSGFKIGAGEINLYGPTGEKIGSPSINYWSETEIRITIPPLRGNSTFQIEVENPKGEKSNRLTFQTKSGQPIISNYPKTTNRGSTIILQGREFGDSSGEIKLYKENSLSNPADSCAVVSWMNNTVNCVVPSSLPGGEYGLSLKTSGGFQASFIYISIN